MRRATPLLLAPVLALVVGCPEGPGAHQPSRSEAPVRGGTVVIGVPSDVENWNPYLTTTAFSSDLLTLLYPTLAVEQTDYREHPPSFAPWLASAWEWSDDGLVLTLTIDRRARWNDGTAVTADDVVFTWKAQTDEQVAWPGATIKTDIAGVEAVDEHTVRVRFLRRYPYQLMDLNDGHVLPSHMWRSTMFADWTEVDWAERAASAGPFRLGRHVRQQEIVLERNPAYWRDGLPRLDRVVFRIVPSQSSLVTLLEAGELDVVNGLPPSEAGRLKDGGRLQVVSYPGRSYTYVGWNTTHPFLADVRVRRALSLAIDRQAIVDSVLRGFGRLAAGPVLSDMWAFNHDLAPVPFDPERARALLAEAGWRDADGDGVVERADGARLSFELLTNQENDRRRDVTVLIAADLARIGVEAVPRLLEWGALLARQRSGEFAAYVSTWREGTQVDLWDVWHSSDEPEASFNYVRYHNPEVDRLLDEVDEVSDAADQKPLLDRIQLLVVGDQPYTWLYEADGIVGASHRVRGAQFNDATPYFNLEEWWVADPGSGQP